MIYTSYFAKLNKLPEDIVPIFICGKAPDFYKGLQYKILAPTYDMFTRWKKDHDNANYIIEYNTKVLSRLEPKRVINDLNNLSGGKDIALICYEKSSDFCHRHLVAEWLNSNGYPCEEYNFGG